MRGGYGGSQARGAGADDEYVTFKGAWKGSARLLEEVACGLLQR